MPSVKAKRGDLAALVSTDRIAVIGEESYDRVSVQLGIVTSVKRDGSVKRLRLAGWQAERDLEQGTARFARVLVIEAGRIDVDAAMAMATAHTYPGHTQIRPFSSVEALRDALRPLLLTAVAS